MSLPKQCLYTNRINSSYARNFQSAIAPQNGTEYNLGETIIINIPCASNLVMSAADTILKFNVNFAQGATANTSYCLNRSGAYAAIQRMRIFLGSTLISDIDAYGNLMDMLITCQQSTDSVEGKYNLMAGTNADTDAGDNAGAANAPVTINYAFPLVSLLSWTNNYVPLFAMSGPLRIELQLVSSLTQFLNSPAAMAAHATLKFIDNVELVANFMEISEAGMNIIRQSIGNSPVQWVCQDYRNFQFSATVKASSTTILSVPIPAKYNSLKSLFWSFRKNASGVATFPANESCQFGMNSYYLRIGPKTMPTKPCSTTPEFFCELLRAFGTASDVNVECNVRELSYKKQIPNIAVVNGSFYGGIDLESYSNCDMTSCYTGYNSSSDDIFFTPTFSIGAIGDQNIRIDTYALFDVLITLENGVATCNW